MVERPPCQGGGRKFESRFSSTICLKGLMTAVTHQLDLLRFVLDRDADFEPVRGIEKT